MLQDIRETRLVQACQQLAQSLERPGKARCMACNATQKPSKGWRIVGYMPDDIEQPPIAYLLCKPCYHSSRQRDKAIQCIETMARDSIGK